MDASQPRQSRRRWSLKVMGGLVGLVLAIGIAEVGLRAFDLAPAGGLATVNEEEFQRVPGIFSPGQHLIDRSVPELPFQVTIDSLGYRGTEDFPRQKPVGELRVLLLGDSFTFGYLVDDDSTLPAQLEGLLRKHCQGPIRVINSGVGGTTIVTAAAMAERAMGLGVDAAVLVFTENDVSDLQSPLWYQMARNRKAKSQFPLSYFYPVARQLALWNLLLKAQAKWKLSRHVTALGSTHTPGAGTNDSLSSPYRSEYARRLHELHDRLTGAAIPLFFGIFPSHYSVNKTQPGELVNWAYGVGTQEGLPTVNLLPALQADGRPKEQLYLFPYDGHPSAAGYRIAAQVLADSLASSQTLARSCAGRMSAAPAKTRTGAP